MAKMFYTTAEAMKVTGLDEAELRELGRSGRLREFRDGPRLMYKGDQVEAVAIDVRGVQVTKEKLNDFINRRIPENKLHPIQKPRMQEVERPKPPAIPKANKVKKPSLLWGACKAAFWFSLGFAACYAAFYFGAL